MPSFQGLTRHTVYGIVRHTLFIVVIWVLMLGLFVHMSIQHHEKEKHAELMDFGEVLYRAISMRTAQHDAMMVGLLALNQASRSAPFEMMQSVSKTMMDSYQRIKGIYLVRLKNDMTVVSTDSAQPSQKLPMNFSEYLPKIHRQQSEKNYAYVEMQSPDHYLLVRRFSMRGESYALILRINITAMFFWGEYDPTYEFQLQLNGHELLMPPSQYHHTDIVIDHENFVFENDSESQPFSMRITKPYYAGDVIDFTWLMVVAVALLVFLFAVRFALVQGLRARGSQRSADASERRAKLSEHETRLVHAMRVNDLGELASGIAHELTQPLTAILSQSQAAVRLHHQHLMDQSLMEKALEANVREAKRAAAILKRMRDYIRNTLPMSEPADVNQVINGVVTLLRADLEKKHIQLFLFLAELLPKVFINVIELEQVIHNLVRNAVDALQQSGREHQLICIKTFIAGDEVGVTVSDNGKGIPHDLMQHIFAPFFTTKKDGMGIGLSLCERLIERVGGRIQAQVDDRGGMLFTLYLPTKNHEYGSGGE
jgi:two-component system sensor kinase FixL